MALTLQTVTKWQADSWKRVRATTGTQYLLNTNRFDSLRDMTGTYASMYYFENPFDARDAGHFMVVNATVATLITAMDTAMTHAHVTLPCYENNDSTESTADITVAIKDIAWAVLDVNSASRSWVAGSLFGWDFVKVLVALTPTQILALVA